MSFVLGLNAKMYLLPYANRTFPSPHVPPGSRGAWPDDLPPAEGETDLTKLIEVKLAQSVTLNIEMATADITTRGATGWREQVATLLNASVDFGLLWDNDWSTFPEFEQIINAALRLRITSPVSENHPGVIAFAILDGPVTVQGSRGLWADFMITSFPRAEELESALTVSCSATPTHSDEPPAWVTSPAPAT